MNVDKGSRERRWNPGEGKVGSINFLAWRGRKVTREKTRLVGIKLKGSRSFYTRGNNMEAKVGNGM